MTVEEEHERWMYVRRLEGALRTAIGLLEIREKTATSVECVDEWRKLLQRPRIASSIQDIRNDLAGIMNT